jgi:uncharacterized membrane protein
MESVVMPGFKNFATSVKVAVTIKAFFLIISISSFVLICIISILLKKLFQSRGFGKASLVKLYTEAPAAG